MTRRVTAHGKQVKLDGVHLCDARDELAAQAIANALEFIAPINIAAFSAAPIEELLQ